MDYRRIVNQVVAGVAVAVLASASHALTIYVDDDGPPAGGGESWADCCRFLQDALYMAAANPIISEIRVAQGTYLPDHDQFNPTGTGDRGATFNLTSLDDVSILGGYAGLGAADPDDRDIAGNPTILTGDLLGDDGPDFTNYGENAYHVVYGNNVPDTVVLDGFIITGGNANGSGTTDDGGGMYAVSSALTVSNCSFAANYGHNGGGMFNHSGTLSLADCSFSGNAAIHGGGLYNYLEASTISHCSFSGNSCTGDGGGMNNHGSSPVLTDCTFTGNVGHWGGGLRANGGTPTITGCSFDDNSSTGGGGAMLLYYTSATVSGCWCTGNWSEGPGGGIDSRGDNPQVLDSFFIGNWSNGSGGGGMYNESNVATLTSCSFIDNTAPMGVGGGVYNWDSSPTVTECAFTENSSDGHGGGMHSVGGNPVVMYSSFSNNSSVSGSGGGMYGQSNLVQLQESSFCGNSPEHVYGSVALSGPMQMNDFCPIPVCPSDTNGDGEVSVLDFLAMLANWGLCP